MALTLGLTGMDQATESEVRAAFGHAARRVRGWSLLSENDADYVIVDMDSMYGPMSWLRLHAAAAQPTTNSRLTRSSQSTSGC